MENNQTRQTDCCRTKYPVVLVHGIGYTDEENPHYWGWVPDALRCCGAEVYFGEQDSYSSVTVNAQQLKERILQILQETGAGKVNLIAHSKGGIDARYMISCLDMADRVASLTTVATPHRGLGAIDTLKENAPAVLRQFYGLFAMMVRQDGGGKPETLDIFDQFSEDYMTVFNEMVPDAPGVYYQSWACDMKQRSTDPPLGIFHSVIAKMQGANDGFVPVTSAAWGEFRGVCLGADGEGISHPMACGGRAKWMEKQGRDDLSSWYVDMVSELRQMGY